MKKGDDSSLSAQESTVLENASLPGLIFCARDLREAKENGIVSLEFSNSATDILHDSAAETAVFWKEKLLKKFDGIDVEINTAASTTVVHVNLRHDGHPANTIVKYLSDNKFFEHENKVTYFLNLCHETSTECEPELQPADEIVVSEGVCKHRRRLAIISVIARSFCVSTGTTREFRWEGPSEISALWDELDETTLKCWVLAASRTTKPSAALSRDERYNQVSSIARTLLAVALRRGIDLRSIYSEAVQSTTKLLDPRSKVPTDLLSFRSSIFAEWGERDRKREETGVLMDQFYSLFARIDFIFHPRKGKSWIDSQAAGVCIALAFLVTWSGNWRRTVAWEEDWAINARAAGADFIAGCFDQDLFIASEPMGERRVSTGTGLEVERLEGDEKPIDSANAVRKEGADYVLEGRGQHEPAFVKILMDQVECGLRRRDSAFLRAVFSRLSEGRPFLTKQQLPQALNEVGIEIEGEDAYSRFAVADCGDLITVEEFLQLIQKLYKSNEWSSLLDLHELLLDALPQSSSEHPLCVIKELSTEEVSCVCEAYCHGLKEVLKRFSNQLRSALDKNVSSDKDFGDIEGVKFAMGLPEPGLVGDSRQNDPLDELCRAQYNLAQKNATAIYDSMEIEHCSKPDSDLLFKSSCSETSSKKEWMAVIEKISEACEGDEINPNISDLANLMCGSIMAKEEIISVVLYTGPMFVKYNCILRRYPKGEFEDLKRKDSLYTTTICLLVSALVKIARSQVDMPKNRILYRGLSGEDPFALWLPCHSGQGLTSTTKDQTVALKFSGVNKGKPWPTIYEISSGDLQHGADVTFLSQYPDQKEVLFPPFCKLIPMGMQLQFSSRALVNKVKLSIQLTHQFSSLDDLRAGKRLIHEQMFGMVLKELERELYWELEQSENRDKAEYGSQVINKILDQGRAHMKAQYDITSQGVFDDNAFRLMIKQTMDVKQMGHGKFSQWFRGDEAEHSSLDLGLLEWKREWTKSMRKQLSEASDEERATMALTLCRSLGLLRQDVTERNELGETPLLAAAACGERPFHLKLLVLAKADIAAHDLGLQRGVLHLAAAYGHTDAIATLVQLGASIMARDSDGKTPCDVAQQCGNVEVASALEKEAGNAQQLLDSLDQVTEFCSGLP